MRSSLRPDRINIDLQWLKQPWLRYCKTHGVTPSEAFRQIVAKLTAGADGGPAVPHESADPDGAKIRKEVRLTKSELHRAESIAMREGFSLGRWIVALINARLEGTPQMGQQELEVLARSNQQMLAIARNLGQLARAANQGLLLHGSVRSSLIEEIHAAVIQHTAQVARVMSANTSRWRQ